MSLLKGRIFLIMKNSVLYHPYFLLEPSKWGFPEPLEINPSHFELPELTIKAWPDSSWGMAACPLAWDQNDWVIKNTECLCSTTWTVLKWKCIDHSFLKGWHVSSSHSFIFQQVPIKCHYEQGIGQGAEFAVAAMEIKPNKSPNIKEDNHQRN